MNIKDRGLLTDLTDAFFAKGGSIHRVPEAPRPTNERLARTRAEQFFRNVNAGNRRRLRLGETYVGK